MTKLSIIFLDRPSCATPHQWREWRAIAKIAPPGPGGFCEDCTKGFAEQMRAQGLCEQPDVWFDANGEGRPKLIPDEG